MDTLLQLIMPAFLIWLLWTAFRPQKRNGDPSGSDSNSSPGGREGHGGSSRDGGGGD